MAGNLTAMIASIFSGGVTPDPYYEYTTLLLPGNGTNGAQNNTFLDGSTNNFTITRNGNTTQGTFSLFSQTGWGNYFNGSNAYLSIANDTSLQLSGDFTIDLCVYLTASTGSNQVLLSKWSTSQGYLIFYDNVTQKINFYNSVTSIVSSSTVSLNTWVKITVTRSGNNYTLYIDGSSVGTSTTASTATDAGGAVNIGRNTDGGSNYTLGYISNLRIIKGSVVTPSAGGPTAPFATGTTNQVLLTCQANRFVDSNTATTAKTVTPNGSPTVVAFSPFNPTASWSAATNGGSGYFDGNSDYLTLNDNAGGALDLGSGQFSVEFWWYPNSAAAGQYPLIGDSTGNWYIIWDNNAGTNAISLGRRGQGNDVNTTGFTLTTGNWQQVVVTRQSTGTNDTRIFVNGVLRGIGTSSQNYTITTTLGIGGTSTGTNVINGYLSSLRIVKGSVPSEYQTSNTTTGTQIFSPPTTPPTAVSGTSLLLNFTNAGIYDATSKNDLETVGDAQISTAQSKWGGSSISFDGTGDWLLIPDQPPQRIGTGNFTIEMWVYRNSSGTYGLAGKGTGTTGWLVSLNSSNQVVFTYGSSTITSSGTVSATTWTHIAVVREGTSTNQTKIYISGTNDGTGTVSTDFNQTNSMYIGADRTGGSAANAYVQDVRITNYARYTGNFTAPTAAFPTL